MRLISDAWKNQFALAAVSHFAENCQRWIGKRHAVILVHLHPLARNFPDCAWPINFGPPSSEHFVRPTNCKNQKAECLRRAAIGAGQLRHELRYFGVGQGGVMTGLSFGRFGSFSRSCFVSSAGLRNSLSSMSTFFAIIVSMRPRTRFEGLALLDPNRLEQLEDVAGQYLRDAQMTDRRVGVLFER